MIITPSLLTALMTSFKKEYQAGQTMAEPAWNKLASKVSSSSKSNTYGWLGQFPQFRLLVITVLVPPLLAGF